MTFKKNKLGTAVSAALFSAALAANPVAADDDRSGKHFERVAVFPVFENTDVELETVAEIVDATDDGRTLVYTDSETGKLGFVDIRKPADPVADGTVDLGGEPTSVAVAGGYALVAVNTSPSFVAPSGDLIVVDIESRTIVATHPLGGQPDAVAVSPDGRYAAIAIENERDEDLGDGAPPQLPAGFLVIVDLAGDPGDWTLRNVDLTGIADLFPEDPEPEYVDINRKNIAVVTLQENNHLVLVDLASGTVTANFSAGTVDLDQIDTIENDLIELNTSLTAVPREPDGVSWIDNKRFATADEGDLNGGSRGFTIYDTEGNVTFTSGNSVDHLVASLGHYPEDRSENKGNEPENVETGRFNGKRYLIVGSERSSVLAVYEVKGRNKQPELVQTLPAGVGPEGLKAIPKRGLLVAASEVDDRGDKIRSVVNIYKLGSGDAAYPTIQSQDRVDGTPIPWGALSGLVADAGDDDLVYTVHDSFYQQSRMFTLDVDESPATITDETVLSDAMGALSAVDANLVNGDLTVNLDLEGIATAQDGGFWLASEGRGTVGDPDRPFEFLNLLLKVDEAGVIHEVVTLPDSANDRQVRFGFEGVTSVTGDAGEQLYVAIQREWAEDPDDHVRIGRYDTASSDWAFYYYPLDLPTSPNGGWVGLSEISYLGDDRFSVVERDNQAGPDATIKRIYSFSVAGLTPLADPAVGTTPAFPVVEKELVRDLIPDLKAPGGLVLEKIEGMAVLEGGEVLIVNDNDGVDDSNGETQLLNLGELFED